MQEKLQTVKDIATIAAPFTSAIVETWIKPKLVKLHTYLKTDKQVFENALFTKFDEYLQRAYDKFSFINILALQNQQRKLVEIYIPLTVDEYGGPARILIDNYRHKFLPAHRKVLISDTAGMGKSTLLKFLFLSSIEQNKGIPIFIELRKLKGNESILQHIFNELNPIDDEFDKEFVLQLIKQGDFIFFLDGYDEIPFSERDLVNRNLQDFISKAGNNLFLLSSRPESSLGSLGKFKEFKIQPLKKKEAFRLLRKYDNGGEVSAEIITKLKSGHFESVNEFLTNPFLVSLLYKSYEYKHIIPFKKNVFYRQVYDALFESHDLTKGGLFIREKHSKLDSDALHGVLRALGFITVRMGQIEFAKDEILSRLREAKQHCAGVAFSETYVLRDLVETVPLFNVEGNYYKWSHKSLQEYFAAQFICVDAKKAQDAILRKMVDGTNITKYYNVLDLCYDLDYKRFRQTIIYDLINKFLNHCGSKRRARSQGLSAISERNALTFECVNVLMRDPAHGSVLNALRARDFVKSKGVQIDQYFDDDEEQSLLIAFTKEETWLIEYLGHKGEEIVRPVKHRQVVFETHEEELVPDNELVEFGSPDPYAGDKESIRLALKSFPEDFYLVDEDEDLRSIMNQRPLFSAVNSILATAHDFILDVENCRKLKSEIDKEIRQDKSDILLIGM